MGFFENCQYLEHEFFDSICTQESLWPNQLFDLKVDDTNVNAQISSIQKKISQNNLPNVLMCEPNTDEKILREIKKYSESESKWTAMSFDINSTRIPSRSNKLQLNLVKDQTDLDNWLRIAEAE